MKKTLQSNGIVGKIFKRLGKLPVLVVSFDSKTQKYRTKQLHSNSTSRTWLEKNIKSGKIEVGSIISLFGSRNLEITGMDAHGCQLVHPEEIFYTEQELIELDADHKLGDRLTIDTRPQSTPRTCTDFAWRQQRARR
jgi:hypothetical protein